MILPANPPPQPIPVAIDFVRNPRQAEFIGDVLLEIAAAQDMGKAVGDRKGVVAPGYRGLHYGGAITGGKTIAGLGGLGLLAKAFPRSRWHVVRASFPDIRRTVLPSLEKVIAGAPVRWRRTADDFYCELTNGSRIYMFAENFSRDKDLNRWKGLETNGFLLEQSEELQEATYYKALERAGRWYNVDGNAMPPPMILNTFNPTWNWVKEKIFDKANAGLLPPDEKFIRALPDDNPWVTAEQWKQWKKMPPDVYERFIRGSWEIEVKGAFLNQFDFDAHTCTGLSYRSAWELWISFDFNVDPMTALIFQTDGEKFFHVLQEYRIGEAETDGAGGDVFGMCEAIKRDWFHLRPIVRVTGDATGDNRMAGVRGALSQYRIIAERLDLDIDEEFHIPGRNPFIGDSRIYCNSVCRWLPDFKIDRDRCPWLVKDCRFVQVGKDREGKIAKQLDGMNPYTNMEAKDMGHLLDCLRYGMHVALPEFVEIHRS